MDICRCGNRDSLNGTTREDILWENISRTGLLGQISTDHSLPQQRGIAEDVNQINERTEETEHNVTAFPVSHQNIPADMARGLVRAGVSGGANYVITKTSTSQAFPAIPAIQAIVVVVCTEITNRL